MDARTSIDPTDLPATIRDFLAAHAVRDTGSAIGFFGADAVVVDDGRRYRGTEDVLGFLRGAGTEFTFTTELVGAERIDDTHWVAINHLEGDFPGGVADLRYRFTIEGDRITELVIAP
jgi:hypothetical protein